MNPEQIDIAWSRFMAGLEQKFIFQEDQKAELQAHFARALGDAGINRRKGITGYNVFFQEQSRTKHKDQQQQDFVKDIADKWRSLDTAQKQSYKDRASELNKGRDQTITE
jgi:hypothetical protein